jgi:ATP-dependent Clp protease adapter protein ClpS
VYAPGRWFPLRLAVRTASERNPPGGPVDRDLDAGHSLVVEEATPKLKRPPLYQVLLRVMLEVHTKGKGVCGVYTFEIAETKVAQVTAYARQHQHPLLCTMEEAD